MRGKRGLGGLACALTAMLLTACYAGIGHMLEEDYNPRFAMPEPLPQVQEPAPPPQVQEPAPPPQELDLLAGEYSVKHPYDFFQTGAALAAEYGSGEAEWSIIWKEGPFHYSESDITRNGNTIRNGSLRISGLSSESDFPVIITCTVKMNNGDVYKDTTKLNYDQCKGITDGCYLLMCQQP